MWIKPHWTPRYIKDRLLEFFYRKLNPDTPWLTPKAIKYFDNWLTKDKVGFELGSGRSTIWTALRCKQLTSVENNKQWYDRIKGILSKKEINNVEYVFAEVSPNGIENDAPYIKPLKEAGDNSLDFVLVDGEYRDVAALLAISKVRSGGMVIVDNCNWFLPSDTKSPASIAIGQKCKTETWEKFARETSGWQKVRTSSGVTDTVFFLKP